MCFTVPSEHLRCGAVILVVAFQKPKPAVKKPIKKGAKVVEEEAVDDEVLSDPIAEKMRRQRSAVPVLQC